MANKTKKASVPFEVLKVDLELLLGMIDQFQNGDYLSKAKSEKMLLAYRKLLSRLLRQIPGARLYTFELLEKLVPIYVVNADQNAVNDELDKKVELPE